MYISAEIGDCKTMAKKKKNSFFVKLLKRLLGLGLIGAAVWVFLSLLFYHKQDSALNLVGSQGVQNLLGVSGAKTVDFCLSFFGVVLPLFLIAFFPWGLNRLKLADFIHPYSRVLAWFLGILAGCSLFSLMPKVCGDFDLGGVVGTFAIGWIMTFVNEIYPYAFANVIVGAILFLFMMLCFDYALGITVKNWWCWSKRAALGFYRIVSVWCLYLSKCVYFVWRAAKRLSKLRLNSSTDDDEIPADEPQPKKQKKIKDKSLRKEPKFGDDTPKEAKQESQGQSSKSPKAKVKEKDDGYVFPDVALLTRPADKKGNAVSQKELDEIARQLESVLEEFGVHGSIVKVRPGPVVTLYELEPAPGTKTARVIGLADDIARSMSAVSVRIAVVPGSNTIGIELPNKNRETVWLRDLIEDEQFRKNKNELNIVLGKDIGGRNVYADLAKMPHLLVAGTTGSGKSVGVNGMILSLLYRMRPDECKFIMIDPKMLEFSMYNGIPHLLTPVITDPAKAVIGLKWAVREMEDRYRAMAQLNVRNIMGYNQKLKELRMSGEVIKRTVQTGFDAETGKPIFEEQELDLSPLPYIVIVVDEMADLMLVAGKEVEAAIQRLAQMARAAGLHLIMSTQRPSVDVITGTIKSNFPTRISYQVTSKIDSRTILGEQGAEQLLGRGDMLYMPAGQRPQRIHGGFAPDAEIEKVVDFIKSQKAPEYVEGVTEGELNTDKSSGNGGGAVFDKGDMAGGGDDDLYNQAVEIVRNDKKASISYVQRRLRIGYNRAAILIERMEEEGVISAPDHAGKREIIS